MWKCPQQDILYVEMILEFVIEVFLLLGKGETRGQVELGRKWKWKVPRRVKQIYIEIRHQDSIPFESWELELPDQNSIRFQQIKIWELPIGSPLIDSHLIPEH